MLQRALDEESGHAAAVLAAERRAARADLDACRAVVSEEALREVRTREAALDRRADELANWARTSTVAMAWTECKGWTESKGRTMPWTEPQTMRAISRSRRAHRACLLAGRLA